MSEYYDKEKFSGGQRQQPPQKKKDEVNWVVVIILFAVGLWPIALIYLLVNWFSGEGKESADEKLRRAQKKFDEAIDSALSGVAGTEESGRKTAEKAKSAVSEAARDMKAAVNEVVHSVSEEVERGKKNAAAKPKRTGKKEKIHKQIESLGSLGVFWQILAGIFVFAAMAIMGEVASDLVHLQTLKYSIESLVVGLNMLAAGGVMFCYGNSSTRFAKRAKKYLAAVGSAESMEIDLIARRVGCGYKRTVKDLEKMIDKGFLGEDAYLDLEMGCFLRFGSAAERRGTQEAQPSAAAPKEAEEGYSGILREIRRANDRIADEALSAKIDSLERITGQILLAVEKKPEKRAKMNTFFDYYLPTTQKLLNAYADFEETGVEGANMGEAKVRIEQAMDSIVAGFAHQLDELYKADAMDVATDLKVMETMLQRDTGGAARDFGFEMQKK